ncbi:hypothetical protein [Streptomyces sp. gb14]|nr:hypothetical protein [Streptomyces sp. gb14]
MLHQRLEDLPHTKPLPFRRQNGGEYDDDLVLRPEPSSQVTGIDAHYRSS